MKQVVDFSLTKTKFHFLCGFRSPRLWMADTLSGTSNLSKHTQKYYWWFYTMPKPLPTTFFLRPHPSVQRPHWSSQFLHMEEGTCRTMHVTLHRCLLEWVKRVVCTNLSVRAASTTESTPPENKMATRAAPCTIEPIFGPQPTVTVSWLMVWVTLGALSTLDWMACWRTDSKCCASVFQSVSWVTVAMALSGEAVGSVAFSLDADCRLPFSFIHTRHPEPWKLNVGSWTVSLSSLAAAHCVEVTCVSLWRDVTTLESQFFVEGSCLFSFGNGTCRIFSLTMLKCKHDLSDDNWSTISVSLWKQTSATKVRYWVSNDVRGKTAHLLPFWAPVNETAYLPASRGSTPAQLQWVRRHPCQRG